MFHVLNRPDPSPEENHAGRSAWILELFGVL